MKRTATICLTALLIGCAPTDPTPEPAPAAAAESSAPRVAAAVNTASSAPALDACCPSCARGAGSSECGACAAEPAQQPAPAPPSEPASEAPASSAPASPPQRRLTHAEDRELFHGLMRRRAEIKRKVKQLDNGVETLTESDSPEVARWIQQHVASMSRRVEQGDPIRMRDPLFRAIFRHADKIRMRSERTAKGVRVIETSDDPYVVKLIKAHAEVVTGFVKNGFAEARRNHPVPAR